MTLALAQPQLDAIADACRRHHVARLDVFGCVLRSDDRPGESDIDLLVEFQPLDPASLYKAYFALLNDLRIGRRRPQPIRQADHRGQPVADRCSVTPGRT